eukprot:m.40893 g.40893  ORF g.40893 m.40893 type:complete len:317 (+) comp18643_c0_seq1:119-1069(+)
MHVIPIFSFLVKFDDCSVHQSPSAVSLHTNTWSVTHYTHTPTPTTLQPQPKNIMACYISNIDEQQGLLCPPFSSFSKSIPAIGKKKSPLTTRSFTSACGRAFDCFSSIYLRTNKKRNRIKMHRAQMIEPQSSHSTNHTSSSSSTPTTTPEDGNHDDGNDGISTKVMITPIKITEVSSTESTPTNETSPSPSPTSAESVKDYAQALVSTSFLSSSSSSSCIVHDIAPQARRSNSSIMVCGKTRRRSSPTMKLRFNDELQVFLITSSHDDCGQGIDSLGGPLGLSNSQKRAITRELNHFKRFEMKIHAQSQQFTRYHL